MTGTEIWKSAMAFLEQDSANSEDYRPLAVHYLNLLLQEALPYENQAREYRGEVPLEKAPDFSRLEDTIPYCDEILRTALPYGLASFFFSNDLDHYRSAEFRTRYLNALRTAAEKTHWERIVDVYA